MRPLLPNNSTVFCRFNSTPVAIWAAIPSAKCSSAAAKLSVPVGPSRPWAVTPSIENPRPAHHEGHRITAHVHDTAASQMVGKQAVFRAKRCVKTEAGMDVPDFADGTVTDQFQQTVGLRVGAVYERFHEKDARV